MLLETASNFLKKKYRQYVNAGLYVSFKRHVLTIKCPLDASNNYCDSTPVQAVDLMDAHYCYLKNPHFFHLKLFCSICFCFKPESLHQRVGSDQNPDWVS